MSSVTKLECEAMKGSKHLSTLCVINPSCLNKIEPLFMGASPRPRFAQFLPNKPECLRTSE